MNYRKNIDEVELTSRRSLLEALKELTHDIRRAEDSLYETYERMFGKEMEPQPEGLGHRALGLVDKLKDVLENEKALADGLKEALGRIAELESALNTAQREQLLKVEHVGSKDVVVVKAPAEQIAKMNQGRIIHTLRQLFPQARGLLVLPTDVEVSTHDAQTAHVLLFDDPEKPVLVFRSREEAERVMLDENAGTVRSAKLYF